jgi:hypothetical protein
MWGALSDESTGLSFIRRNCCWPSLAQSFSAPSPAGLMTIFYCLRFETPLTWRARSRIYIPQLLGSLFVATYYSQGYGGGIRTRLHAVKSKSKAKPAAIYWTCNCKGDERKLVREVQKFI